MFSRPLKICASLVCADLLHLERELRVLEAAGVDSIHIDVMDGQFVPNYCLSPDVMRAVRRASALPMDVHLMVVRPEQHLEAFVQAGADVLVVHQEATVHLQRTLARIRELGARAGVALNVATPLNTLNYVLEDIDLLLIMTVNPGFTGQKLVPATLRKIADARAMVDARGLPVDIQVDGNVSFETAPKMVRAGANWLVGGTSSLFNPKWSVAEGVQRLRQVAEEARTK
ncbi:MAG: ribulose-phosphate 3-epimerase [Chloroflexi bacterium]|nr:ribulose-phosphate 3-epimerase [Chloroflexota bacterium]